MKKTIASLLVFSLLAILISGCSKSSNKLESIKSSGKISVYTNANFPPFEYMKGNDIVGVDMEIAKAIADELEVTPEVKDADFDGIITSLASGKGDIAISGFTITEERKKEVDFSKPYINSVQYLIIPKDSTIATMEGLEGKKVGAALGYTGQFVMEDEMDKGGVLEGKNVDLTIVNSALDGSLDIINKKLDAVVMDEYVAKKIASENEQLSAVPLVYENGDDVAEEYGVAVPKGNEELIDIINGVIDKLIEEGKIEDWVIENS